MFDSIQLNLSFLGTLTISDDFSIVAMNLPIGFNAGSGLHLSVYTFEIGDAEISENTGIPIDYTSHTINFSN